MKYIDEKFKAVSPKETVDKIKAILTNLGIEVTENWNDSGLENCKSLSVVAKGGMPSTNGKGITEDFARASAYAEFIERLQIGLFFYKLQDIGFDKEMYLHRFAPDAKYMTEKELIDNGEWMDYLTEEYGENITREVIAKYCKLCSQDEGDKILTVPFYSLFEDKYVYMPIGFVEQMYTTNGCCAGNTRNEAWVHALAEIMERHASLKVLTSGKAVPAIPEDVLRKFPIVSNILDEIKSSGEFDIDILDYSIGNGFPVVATRIIDKKNHGYRVNVAADPVLEIAIQRTLTELFQGKSIHNFTAAHNGLILGKLSDYPLLNNVINQLESSSGAYVADFFANEITCERKATEFEDRSGMTNDQLLEYMLDLYRKQGKQIYVRNFSFLGFPSYKFIVPGFSETRALKLNDTLADGFAKQTAKTLKDIAAADDKALSLFLMHSKMLIGTNGRYNYFNRLSGVPLTYTSNWIIYICRSYASYRLKAYADAVKFLEPITKSTYIDRDIVQYFSLVSQYLTLLIKGVSQDKIKVILYRFFEKKYADMFYSLLDSGKTPYDNHLLKCDKNCSCCRYKDVCVYESCKNIILRSGKKYSQFTNGQDKNEFAIN